MGAMKGENLRRVALGIVVFLMAAATSTAASDKPAAVPNDAQDLVLFLEARPYLIRLHLQVNGRSFRRKWDESLGHLFRYLDANGDGAIDAQEATLAPSTTQWVQLTNGKTVEPDAAPDFAVLAGNAAASKATLENFLRYYRGSGGGALQVEWGWRPLGQDKLSAALFRRLDKNKDESLSRAELENAQSALRLLDMDDDEIIRAFELDAAGVYPVFTFRAATEQQPVPKNFPFVLLQSDTPTATLIGEMWTRYDHNKDRKFSRKELPLEKASFDRLDVDHDGGLSAAELAAWRKLPPELELIVPLEAKSRKDLLLMPTADGKTKHLSVLAPPKRGGVMRIRVGEQQLELSRVSGLPSLRQSLLKQFDGMSGKDGVLDEKTIYRPPFTFVALLRLADRNRDNRLSRKEIADYLELQENFLFRSTYLTVVDRGESLFEFLDADHDGRLSPREQRSAWKRLAPWSDEGERIARRRVPRQFQLVLSHGRPRNQVTPMGNGHAGLPLFRDPTRGPLWFRKMDRNGDGDVSRREFLGEAAQFRRLDGDGDDLIDVEEAERADQKLRKRP